MIRPPRVAAFTLIEMITVITVIAILASLILAVNGLVQRKAASSRAQGEISQLAAACEAYKTDNGGYPQDANYTDKLDARLSVTPSDGKYAAASKFLYQELTGDADNSGRIESGETARNYAGDFLWKPNVWGKGPGTIGTGGYVAFITDPFGYSYGYSTAQLAAEQTYRQKLSATGSASRPTVVGYNPTIDLWSTGGGTSSLASDTAKWIKNW